MQLKIIFVIGFVCLFNEISSNEVELPVQACATALLGGDMDSCTEQLATAIWNIHKWSPQKEIKICGNSCRGMIKGRFHKWQWKWDGKFYCDSQAPGIVGTSSKFSRVGALEWAIKDYINKGIAANHFQLEDFQCCRNKDWSFCTSIDV